MKRGGGDEKTVRRRKEQEAPAGVDTLILDGDELPGVRDEPSRPPRTTEKHAHPKFDSTSFWGFSVRVQTVITATESSHFHAGQ